MTRQSNTETPKTNSEFEFRGINHLALVCRDMARTVDFYQNVLGMPLIKTIDLPGGAGQHFFFDIGNGDSLAFFWFPDAPEAAPGIASPKTAVGLGNGDAGEWITAHASMNHVAFDVPPEKIEEYHRRLQEKGIECSVIFNHDNSPRQVSREPNEDTFVRSIYFLDPDGIMLEFAAWTRVLRDDEATLPPKTAADARRAAGVAGR